MKRTSEWVSPAHPDRLADCIAARIIDEIIAKDGFNSHAAIEVFITDNHVIVGGEATTTLSLTSTSIEPYIKEVLVDIGYNTSLRNKGFTKSEVYTSNDYKISSFVIPQSPDIAKGVGIEKGFNDNGIFFGYAEDSNPLYLGLAHAIATELGECLYKESLKEESIFGPDIKTLITVDEQSNVTDITVSIPTIPKVVAEKETTELEVTNIIKNFFYKNTWTKLSQEVNIIINGTGRYSIHGSKGDSGLTGRKIVVNHTGGYAPNGGGSQIKGFTAADSLLNFASRWIAKSIVKSGLAHSCTTALSCAIGQKKLQSFSVLLDGEEPEGVTLDRINTVINSIEFSPKYLNSIWDCYYSHHFYNIVKSNFYGKDQDWEKNLLVF